MIRFHKIRTTIRNSQEAIKINLMSIKYIFRANKKMRTKCNRNKKIVFDKTVGKLKSREKVPEKDDT